MFRITIIFKWKILHEISWSRFSYPEVILTNKKKNFQNRRLRIDITLILDNSLIINNLSMYQYFLSLKFTFVMRSAFLQFLKCLFRNSFGNDIGNVIDDGGVVTTWETRFISGPRLRVSKFFSVGIVTKV